MYRFRDPVDAGIATNLHPVNEQQTTKQNNTTNRFVVGVDQDHFVILVNTILVDPIRVQHPQISTTSANSLLGGASQSSLGLEVVNTLVHGLAVCSTCKK